ncbi:hypothetical protein DEJ49_13665 [Streptomyces venezuelae]|uniref:Uncharacterized protein n=1 Tax=Streptomyces venezuelae TaxID=54571 RepID=A0A5P2CM98_STRVZ|nr:hypothetical protein [Streptomyces venezuelae]QES41909.1 hypothetical protein DEJ49_13665 [Streptomyces venezuelae]
MDHSAPRFAPPPFARRLLTTARSTRFRLERTAAGRVRGPAGRAGTLLAPVHLSLRDSRTLNVALAAPHGPGRARLLITRGPRRIAVPLTYEPHTGATPLLTATVTLRGMRDGVWRLTVETRDADGRVRRYGLAPADSGTPPATPTAPHAPDPRTGTLVRVVRARSGRAVLQATRSRPRAELVRFVPSGDGITVYGRLVAGGPPGAAEAVRRRDGVVVPAEVEWEGAAFALRVPLAAMAGAGPGQWVWDFRVGRLPVGRWLTDVRDPSAAYPTPFRVHALPGGALVRAHAHFTRTGAFAVTCWDITDAVRESDAPRDLAEETS